MHTTTYKQINKTSSFPVAIVVSQFNEPISKELLNGAYQELMDRGVVSSDILVVEVPGAVEIPIVAKRLVKNGHYESIIALGCVIRGETSHYDYVCEQVSQGCQKISLDYEVPVIFGVLTTENEAQAWDRLGGAHGHKGKESANVAIAMHSIMNELL